MDPLTSANLILMLKAWGDRCIADGSLPVLLVCINANDAHDIKVERAGEYPPKLVKQFLQQVIDRIPD
jgi:hypothetical protein